MPKRNSTEKLEYYKNKIRKLKKKQFHRLRVLSSSDLEQSHETDEPTVISQTVIEPEPTTATQQQSEEEIQEPLSQSVPDPNKDESPLVENSTSVNIDPSVLAALGEIVDEEPEYGEKIHESLAKIWTPLLKKGMSKESKDQLLKKYLVPENCTFLQAPTLNPEIQAAMTESGKFRDKKLSRFQQQLGVGITAISRGLNILVNDENKLDAIKDISDGCRILCDLHYQDTETRTKFIVPCLDKSFSQYTEQSERDSTLFGANFAEKIKSAQSIAKQGQQIRKTLTVQKPFVSTPSRTSFQGNGSGPSRYVTNRGGRGGPRRVNYRTPPASTSTQSRTTNYKYCAPTRR